MIVGLLRELLPDYKIICNNKIICNYIALARYLGVNEIDLTKLDGYTYYYISNFEIDHQSKVVAVQLDLEDGYKFVLHQEAIDYYLNQNL